MRTGARGNFRDEYFRGLRGIMGSVAEVHRQGGNRTGPELCKLTRKQLDGSRGEWNRAEESAWGPEIGWAAAPDLPLSLVPCRCVLCTS